MLGGIPDYVRTATAHSEKHDPLAPGGVEHGGEVGICDLFDQPVLETPP
jgi:hypothetical protein